jgi:hypothetical protein
MQGVNLYRDHYPERFDTFALGWFTMLGIATGDSWTAEVLTISSRFLVPKVSTVTPSRRLRQSAVRDEGQVDPDVGGLLYTDVEGLLELPPGIEGKWGAPSHVPGMWAPTTIPQRWHTHTHTHTLTPGLPLGMEFVGSSDEPEMLAASAREALRDGAGPGAVRREGADDGSAGEAAVNGTQAGNATDSAVSGHYKQVDCVCLCG